MIFYCKNKKNYLWQMGFIVFDWVSEGEYLVVCKTDHRFPLKLKTCFEVIKQSLDTSLAVD